MTLIEKHIRIILLQKQAILELKNECEEKIERLHKSIQNHQAEITRLSDD